VGLKKVGRQGKMRVWVGLALLVVVAAALSRRCDELYRDGQPMFYLGIATPQQIF
jgi:hypothetical protein